MMLQRLASNAFANLLTGVSGTVFQIGVTAIATRSFTKNGFAIWALAISLSALVPLFSASLSTIITRRIVELAPSKSGAIFKAGIFYARRLSVFSFISIFLFAMALKWYSQTLAQITMAEFCVVISFLVGTQVWQIFFQPYFGWCFACEKNWRVAKINVLVRSGSFIGMALFCWKFPGQLVLGAFGLIFGGACGLFFAAKIVNNNGIIYSDVKQCDEINERYKILPFIKAFAIWSIGSAAIQSGLPTIMSIIAPEQFSAFFLAYTLNLVVIGVISSISSALLAPLTRLRLKGNSLVLEKLMAVSPFVIGGGMLVLMMAIWILLPRFLPIWSPGIATAEEVRAQFFWLALQTMTRTMSLIHSILLSTSGRADQIHRPILFEIFFSSTIALFVGISFGGFAFIGTLSIVGLMTSVYMTVLTLYVGGYNSLSKFKLVSALIISEITVAVLWLYFSNIF